MNYKEGLRVGVIGASSLVGRELLAVLAERQFPAASVRAFTGVETEELTLEYKEEELTVEPFNPHVSGELDIAFFCAGSEMSKQHAPEFVEKGVIVVDSSSYWRLNENVPLIIPEVNSDLVRKCCASRTTGVLFSSPNAVVVELGVILNPILCGVGIKRVVVSTYESTSGRGQPGMEELWNQVRGLLMQESFETRVFPHQVAFNCIPQIGDFDSDGNTAGERKVICETKKVFPSADFGLSITSVQVPTYAGNCLSVNLETEAKISKNEVRELLRNSPGIIVEDDPVSNSYPMAISIESGEAVYVGRIREDRSVEKGISLWVVADNVRKGSAVNMVQIAEICLEVM